MTFEEIVQKALADCDGTEAMDAALVAVLALAKALDDERKPFLAQHQPPK